MMVIVLAEDLKNPLCLKNKLHSYQESILQRTTCQTKLIPRSQTGIRGSNDLVWVGRSANYAAKLCSLSPEYPSRITETVYNKLNDSAKYSSDGKPMWEAAKWTDMNNMKIYRSLGGGKYR